MFRWKQNAILSPSTKEHPEIRWRIGAAGAPDRGGFSGALGASKMLFFRGAALRAAPDNCVLRVPIMLLHLLYSKPNEGSVLRVQIN